MLSSIASDQTLNTVPSSSSCSSSSSPFSPFSPPSSFSLQTTDTTNHPRTMEEVWKDINLACLSESTNPNPNRSSSSLLHINLPNGPHHHHPNFRNMTLQDFLARPFGNNEPPHHHPPPPTHLLPSSSADTALHSPASPLPPPPSATTLLTLNNPNAEFQPFHLPGLLIRPPNSEFQPDHLQSQNQHHSFYNLQSNPNNISSSVSNSFSGCPFESLATSSSGFPSFGKRTFPDSESDHINSGDRRHKRMIKNRESAARSRARKQECISPMLPLIKLAYTNELELEVAHLMEENAKLRRQQAQICYAASTQQPKRHNFHRSSTAPF